MNRELDNLTSEVAFLHRPDERGVEELRLIFDSAHFWGIYNMLKILCAAFCHMDKPLK
jgi:hypothetical protein